jgi:hypothetical protein
MVVCFRAALALVALVSAAVSHATIITTDATNLGDATWRYDYTITNDTLGGSLDYFVLAFDRELYANLRNAAAPVGWDILVLQPDLDLPDDGVFDALALDGGIAPGATLAGFSITFDFLGVNIPMSQPFSVLDPFTFDVVENGTAPVVAAVPEPSSSLLFLSGALILIGLHARRFRRQGSAVAGVTA